jgi:hypothetical protein
VKFGFIAKYRGVWPVDVQCGALGVSRSGFYAWCERPESARSRTDAAILQTIRVCFAASDATYGARRMITDVRAAGHTCGRQRVARLMRSAALRARPRRRARPADTGDRALHMIAPNVLDREFTAPAPNQKWVADFTTGDRCVTDGGLAPGARAPLSCIIRIKAVHERAVSAATRQSGRHMQHESLRQRVGQCRDGEFLLDDEDRAMQSERLSYARCSARRRVRLHRAVLQSHAKTLIAW